MDKIVHASKKTGGSDCWGTPQKIIQLFEQYLGKPFDLDAAASAENAICSNYITEEMNSLTTLWQGQNVWLNPPYSLNKQFLKRCVEMQDYCENIVVLIPARTDTEYWHNYVMHYASTIWFIKGRIKFVGAPAGAPFPSAIIKFNKVERTQQGLQFFSWKMSPTARGF